MYICGIVACVNYSSFLEKTLALNMRHMSACLVITSHDDEETKKVAHSVPNVTIYETDAFTKHGAYFNKGLAFEEAFDLLRRSKGQSWYLIWDADILFPSVINLNMVRQGYLHGAYRRVLQDPLEIPPESEWRRLPRNDDGGPIGFFQLFQADDPVLKTKRPWYDVTFSHGGGGDAYFITHWSRARLRILPIEVLHLGPVAKYWFGTDKESQLIMDAYVIRNGWKKIAKNRDTTAIANVGSFIDRVQVPGYPKSDFEIGFVKRAKQLRHN